MAHLNPGSILVRTKCCSLCDQLAIGGCTVTPEVGHIRGSGWSLLLAGWTLGSTSGQVSLGEWGPCLPSSLGLGPFAHGRWQGGRERPSGVIAPLGIHMGHTVPTFPSSESAVRIRRLRWLCPSFPVSALTSPTIQPRATAHESCVNTCLAISLFKVPSQVRGLGDSLLPTSWAVPGRHGGARVGRPWALSAYRAEPSAHQARVFLLSLRSPWGAPQEAPGGEGRGAGMGSWAPGPLLQVTSCAFGPFRPIPQAALPSDAGGLPCVPVSEAWGSKDTQLTVDTSQRAVSPEAREQPKRCCPRRE